MRPPGPRTWVASWCTKPSPAVEADPGEIYETGYEAGRRSVLDQLRTLLEIAQDAGDDEDEG